MPRLRHQLSRLRSVLLFAPLYGIATAAYGLASMACARFDASGRRQHRVAQAWARMLLRIAHIRVRTEGLQRLLPQSNADPAPRPMVMVCNHLSYMDVPVLFAVLPLQFRILARQGLFRIPFLGGHLRRAHHLPVDQSNVRSSMRSLQQAAAAVASGLPLFIFPEAGRSFSGVMQDFVPGAFYIAIQAQVPVVPMVLIGTYELLPPSTAHLRPGVVRLLVGDPIPTAGLTRHDAIRLSQQVHDQMAALYATHHPQPVA